MLVTDQARFWWNGRKQLDNILGLPPGGGTITIDGGTVDVPPTGDDSRMGLYLLGLLLAGIGWWVCGRDRQQKYSDF